MQTAADAGAQDILECFAANGTNINGYDNEEEGESGPPYVDSGDDDAAKAISRIPPGRMYRRVNSYDRDELAMQAAVAAGIVELAVWLIDVVDMEPSEGIAEAAGNGHLPMLEILNRQW
ncbi:hypothetical protein JG687_00009813 [Phytophthora cactorum]|uniref:Ankyrin repeat-containing domain n=1 Tax=Phytophthora cactorum TaxID=29920 RepID=A0A329S2Y0_9STRA|nr:hypothetical protein Pcac1_g4221 [Phytophthora cactorum]KAG2811839.1 hypothetical protein PC111_g15068 [Phytophthora cactorum]KAG2817654.1 hypothetical protein PC112_g12964 [Phytophthora cactorum]KAG2855184.1 hypothetical protein PC113_g12657 [Phytophthora cactorum]KAG2905616.1 hypothetical protein PC115_g14548 [Phytophthora cactorum]